MSTSMKDSMWSQLGMHYRNASIKVFEYKPYITIPQEITLFKFNKRLDKAGILQKDYAYGVMHHLHDWVRKRGWKTIPVNVFCGKWCKELYLQEIGNRQFTYIQDSDEIFKMLVMEEFFVMRYCEFATDGGYEMAVEDMMPMMSDKWMHLYESHRLDDVRIDAKTLYKDIYGVEFNHV